MVCCCLSLGTGYKGTAQNGGQEQACCSKRNKAYPGSTAAPSVTAAAPGVPAGRLKQPHTSCSGVSLAWTLVVAGSLIAITSLYCIRMAVQGCRENMQRPRASGACYIYTYRLRIFRYGD